MLAASGAETLLVADVREAIGASPWRDAILLLLIADFGIKAGLVPLHVWLPLAHSAAPTPASAVLSGPSSSPASSASCSSSPSASIFPSGGGTALGRSVHRLLRGCPRADAEKPQDRARLFDHQPDGPRHRRAGGSLAGKFAGDRIAAASLYALHHGLAKGALFMHLGVVAVCGARSLVPVLAVLSLPALSLAGLPLTGGALAKLAAKPPLGGGMPELLFTLSAIGTSLLMLRFMLKVAES